MQFPRYFLEDRKIRTAFSLLELIKYDSVDVIVYEIFKVTFEIPNSSVSVSFRDTEHNFENRRASELLNTDQIGFRSMRKSARYSR